MDWVFLKQATKLGIFVERDRTLWVVYDVDPRHLMSLKDLQKIFKEVQYEGDRLARLIIGGEELKARPFGEPRMSQGQIYVMTKLRLDNNQDPSEEQFFAALDEARISYKIR